VGAPFGLETVFAVRPDGTAGTIRGFQDNDIRAREFVFEKMGD
jgi:hypothetical protein